MITAINLCTYWIIYEIGVGTQVLCDIYREHKRDQFLKKWHSENGLEANLDQSKYPKLFKHRYIPPTILFRDAREQYVDWKEWKGERFK